MANPYFKFIPNFEYISRIKGSKNISDYISVKNIFKRGKIRDDIIENLMFFDKYIIIGDERPDNVAYKIYNDENLDWIILLSNNILDVRNEWPMPQVAFDNYLMEKYKIGNESEQTTYDRIYNGIHHYESTEIKNSQGTIILNQGIIIPENFSLRYYDLILQKEIFESNISVPITNYEYENKLQEEKRTIFILKSKYLNLIYNDLENIMTYKEGSEQYVSRTLKRGDNIRLYQ
jgi:hypothetical protein